jgi:uncharacterized YigZ family protein
MTVKHGRRMSTTHNYVKDACAEECSWLAWSGLLMAVTLFSHSIRFMSRLTLPILVQGPRAMSKKRYAETGSRMQSGHGGEPGHDSDDGFEEELATSCFVSELVVKKSRFIACVGPAPTASDAFAFIAAASEPDARHNCWAFRVGSDLTRSSDDGEPSGTAGKPILASIERSGLSHVVVVVVRYFGGIKLGAPGLTRAYSNAASACLKGAPRQRRLFTTDIQICVPHNSMGSALAVVDKHKVINVEYR